MHWFASTSAAKTLQQVQRKHWIPRCGTVFLLIYTCFPTTSDLYAQKATSLPTLSSATVGSIGSIEASVHPHNLTIEIEVSAPVVPESLQLTNPPRLVFDFAGFELQGTSRRIPVDSGPVREVRAALFQVHPPITRIVVDSNKPLSFDLKPDGNKVLIEVVFPTASADSTNSDHKVASIQKQHEKSSLRPQGQPENVLAAPTASPSAYHLQDKAKTLTIADLSPLEDKAQSGDPEAETILALAYHGALLLKRNDEEALRLLHKAADQGYMAAQESLGIFAETGIGMKERAPQEAVEWYGKAIRQGSLDAATNLALMYADGVGISKDPGQALTWFRRAADGGDATAQYNLALIYARGNGVPQDNKESVRWLTSAADQNLLPATLDLAAFYLRPPDGSDPDIGRAIHYYEKAADLGSARAEAILGNIFATGAQGKPDYEQAVKWYRRAADQGQPDAQFGLAVRYALGQGLPVDLQEALRLFTAAADQGHAGAEYNLATMYEEGNGTPADLSLAAHYYQPAADQGIPQAQFRLGILLASNKESRSDRVSAYKWLMLADTKESSSALSNLSKSMDKQEIAEAEREVDNWRLAHRGNRP
jgi:uncharacterized protein